MTMLEAYRAAQNHHHEFKLLTSGIEVCSCGLIRAAYPDESIHPKESASC